MVWFCMSCTSLCISIHYYPILCRVCLCQMPWLNDFAQKTASWGRWEIGGLCRLWPALKWKIQDGRSRIIFNSFFVFHYVWTNWTCQNQTPGVPGHRVFIQKMNRCGRKNLPSHSTRLRLNGTSEFRNCVAGAGGALFARGDLNLAKRLGRWKNTGLGVAGIGW